MAPDDGALLLDALRHGELDNSGAPELRLGTYEGPLDLLLELARAQRVDLAAISVVELAEAFGAAVERAIAGRRVPLSQMADWMVMAAWLLLLRSRLLLPPGSEADRAAQAEAAALRRRLADRAAVHAMASWLERRPQLGREIFGQGAPAPEPQPMPLADITELLRACLRLIALPMRQRVYRPNPPPLWRVPDALARIRGMLATLPGQGAPLAHFVPRSGNRARTPLQQRAALASTLVAALELGRDSVLTLEQTNAFQEIRLHGAASGSGIGAPGPPNAGTSRHVVPSTDAEVA
ncbi:segregation and condensation protein A [Falsiroseomonas sp. E2-1-a20]|uniref:segregation and condensation protein A n=1 Tax=Falsiroseomonas sp. E2-1-a20 TaxID=3239300 RepID=UPI003F34C465